MIHSLQEIVAHAREGSPFYRELYDGLPEDAPLERLPIVDQGAFWAAASAGRLLTGPLSDGVVYKSGGTTGSPKFSVFTRAEWETFCTAFGRGLDSGGLRDGDRVANLFYAGDLYASFLFIGKSLELARARVTHFPLTGASSPAVIAQTVADFGIDTLAGVPTTLLAFAQHVLGKGLVLPSVRRVLFGGESMYADQRALMARAFPGVAISSIGYASVDAGLLGYADPSCGPEEHRAFGRETSLEIVDDDSGEAITVAGRPGRVLITNLTRKLMPVIRYPAGDRAMWVDAPGSGAPRFALLGRSEEGARVGPVTLYYDDVRQVVVGLGLEGLFQMVVTREQQLDALTLRIAVADPERVGSEVTQALSAGLAAARPLFEQVANAGKIHGLRVEWLAPSQLAVNPRTGKLRRIIDQRLSEATTRFPNPEERLPLSGGSATLR